MAAGGPRFVWGRLPLDVAVERARDPAFAARHRRPLSFRETSRHVSPVMLAAADPDSLYVRSWRPHVRECGACARLFAEFRLETEDLP